MDRTNAMPSGELALRPGELEGRGVPLWAWLVVAFAVAGLYALTMENGATLRAGASVLHELFHDGRHFLGVPCH